MSVKFSPSTDWMVQSQYRKEYILQVVGETITRKKWRSSLYNANNDFPASGEVMEDGFSINFSNLEKKSRSELRVPLKVKMRLEGKLALLDCKVGFSDVKLFFMILFYAFWRMLAYMMGIRRGM